MAKEFGVQQFRGKFTCLCTMYIIDRKFSVIFSYWKYVVKLLLKLDLICQWNKDGRYWLKVLDHGYCDEWRQALNFWPFILKSWIILMKMSTVFSLMHVITPLPSTQSKLKSFPNSNSDSSFSNVTFNSLVTLFQITWGRGAWVSWPRCTSSS